MALADNQLFRSADGPKPLPRTHFSPHGIKVATLAEDASVTPAQVTLKRLSPLVWDTDSYRAWIKTDARVHVLLADDNVVLDLTDDVLANVVIRGQVSFLDIPNTDGSDTNSTLLKAALRSGMRELGIDITDLDAADLPS